MRPQAHKKADFVFGAGKAVLEEDDGASGSVKIVFVQITWRHFEMQLSDNKYSTFLGVAWCHQIEATARANVPQRCLEQRFACAVICRKPLRWGPCMEDKAAPSGRTCCKSGNFG